MTNAEQNPPTQRNRWPGGWMIALLVIAFAVFQSSAVKELYFSFTGVQFPESSIPWQHDLDTALTTAQDQKRPVLLVFGATWCPPCKKMKREVWPDAKVAEAVQKGFVPMYVDVDDQTQSKVTAQYRVNSVPTILILNSEGQVVLQRSSMNVSQTLEFLNASL